MENNQIQDRSLILDKIVQQVLYLVAKKAGAGKGYALVLFTGASAGYESSLRSLENLMLKGFALRICFSDSAKILYGPQVLERLLSWPFAREMSPDKWLTQVADARVVVVPMLSVNTLSKATSLMADSLAGNILLQSFFMAKPVVAAVDGAVPGNGDRIILGLDQGNSVLQKAVADRLAILEKYGCRLSKSHDLARDTMGLLGFENSLKPVLRPETQGLKPGDRGFFPDKYLTPTGLISAATIRMAHHEGFGIKVGPKVLITPLARELSARLEVKIVDI